MMEKYEENDSLPLVSIIIPCYNSEKYIGECIESVLAQDYDNIEIIVVNDGSTDDSIQILRQYKDIFVYSQENSGACVARNNGLEKSHGKYIKFLDSDDFLELRVIKKQVDLAESLNGNIIVYGDYYISKEGNKSYESTFLSYSEQTASLILGDILTSTPLHSKWMLEKIKGFDERFKNGQEWNLHIRLSSEGFIFHHQKVPIFSYRIHSSADRISSIKHNNSKKAFYEALKIEMTKERMSNNSIGDFNAALSLKYWVVARDLYCSGHNKEYEVYLKKSKLLSNNYKKFWNLDYRIVYEVLGFRLTQKVLSLYDIIRKRKVSKFL